MANPWYKTGTVSVTNNSKNVAGVGTLFVINSIAAGDIFFAPDGNAYEVDSVQSDTLIVLTKEYAGSTATNQSYSIVRFIAQSPISLANLIVDKTVKWETLIDQHALYLSGDATSTVTAPENICVNYSLGEVKTDIAQADCPTGFTYVVSGANLNAGWFLFNDTVGNYRVAQHPETFKAEIEAIKDTAVSAKDSVVVSADLISELDIRTFEPTVKPTLKFDFARNEAIVYDGAEHSFVSKSVTQAVTDGDLTVSNGASNVYDARGRLAPVPFDRARLTFNPETGESEGLLVEEARTNLIDKPYGFIYRPSKGDNVVLTPFLESPLTGSLNATKYSILANTLRNVDSLVYVITSGVMYSYTLIVKPLVDTQITIRATNAGAFNNALSVFDVTAGEIVTLNATYDCIADATTRFGFYDSSGDAGDRFIVLYESIEQGSFPTSPIPESSTFVSRASTGTYYDSTGTLQTAAIDEARYTYNPADLTAPPVLMDEVGRTNYNLNNQTTSGYQESTTITKELDTNVKSIDGVSSSIKLSCTGGTGYIRANGYNFPSSEAFTASIFVKAGSRSVFTCTVRAGNDSNSEFIGVIDLNDPSTYIGKNVQPVGNGWFRIWNTSTSDDITGDPEYIEIRADSATSGETFYVCYGQVEEGTYPTSPIKTGATPVTRSEDVVSYAQSTRVADNVYRDLSGYEFGASEGTFFGEFKCTTEDSLVGLFTVGESGNSSNELSLRVQSGTVRVDCGDVGQVISTGFYPNGQFTKYCLTYTLDTVNLYIGGVKYSANGISLPSLFNRIQFGLHDWSTSRLSRVECKFLEYRPKALPQAEAIALTGGA